MIDKFIDSMIEEGDCMSNLMDSVTENVKARICDHYCKYPEQYKVKGDTDIDRMLNEVCESCPLNVL